MTWQQIVLVTYFGAAVVVALLMAGVESEKQQGSRVLIQLFSAVLACLMIIVVVTQ